jgi:hypothetical protein
VKDLTKILFELAELLFRQEVRSSSTELAHLISDDFIEVGASGLRFGKANVLERLPIEVAPEITASNYELRILSSDCAQLLYKAKMSKVGQSSSVY